MVVRAIDFGIIILFFGGRELARPFRWNSKRAKEEREGEAGDSDGRIWIPRKLVSTKHLTATAAVDRKREEVGKGLSASVKRRRKRKKKMHNEENPRETKELRVGDGMRGRGGQEKKKRRGFKEGSRFVVSEGHPVLGWTAPRAKSRRVNTTGGIVERRKSGSQDRLGAKGNQRTVWLSGTHGF